MDIRSGHYAEESPPISVSDEVASNDNRTQRGSQIVSVRSDTITLNLLLIVNFLFREQNPLRNKLRRMERRRGKCQIF